MKLSSQDKFLEETLRNISGETIEDIDKVLKSLMMYLIMQYSENEIIRIPYFGAFKFKYLGDEITNEGRVANLESLYIPSNEIKLNIGMWEDIKNNGGDVSELPLIKDIMRNNKFKLDCVVNDCDMNIKGV